MALRAVPEHPKFAHLKSLLGAPKCHAAGYLEMVWHFTGKFTPQGNIGKYGDAAIEAWVEWPGAIGVLISALCESRWLEKNPVYRLIVHDWHDHADAATKLALKRANLDFVTRVSQHCSDTVATVLGLPVPEPEPEPVPEPVLKPFAQSAAGEKENPHEGGGPSKAARLQWFEEKFWPIVWAKIAKRDAEKAWLVNVKNEFVCARAVAAARDQGPSILERGNRPGCSVLHPATWINGKRWEDELSPNGQHKRKSASEEKTERMTAMLKQQLREKEEYAE